MKSYNKAKDAKPGQKVVDFVDRDRRFSLWLLYAVCFVEGADTQLLPSTFRALEADVGLSPQDLAMLGMCQAAAACLAAPFFGILVDRGCPGKWILVAGSAAWGLLTFLLACITDFTPMLVLRTLNGIALATLTPVSQAVIAKFTRPHERGTYFGYCGSALMLGSLVCSLAATGVSNMTILGYEGWRTAFVVVAVLSVVLSLLLACCMRESQNQQLRDTSVQSEFKVFLGFFRIKSFAVIVIQGCFGSVPWSALSFCTMFFQYVGMPDTEAAALYSILVLSLAFGSIIGGLVSDSLTAWSRYHGRPLAAQISVMAGIPVICTIFLGLPAERESQFWYAVLLITFGLTASWCGAGVNRPVLTDIVPEWGQARVIGWLAALEGSMAACLGAPLTGLLAQHVFGYQAQRHQMSEISPTIRHQNAHALAMGMTWMTILPWCACFIAFSFLHLTYRKDVEKARLQDETTKLNDNLQMHFDARP